MVCAFTGHRPHKLPWGSEEQDPRCIAVKTVIEKRLMEALDLGCHTFLCGMAQGCDLYFAEAVLRLRQLRPEIRLIAMLPCPGQADVWREEDRDVVAREEVVRVVVRLAAALARAFCSFSHSA